MWDEIAREAQLIDSADGFKQWMRKSIRSRIPHKAMFGGFGHAHATGLSADFGVSVDCPAEHLQTICNDFGTTNSPILQRWFLTREIVAFEREAPWSEVPPQWLASFDKHLLRNVIGQGHIDHSAGTASFFTFYGFAGRIDFSHVDTVRRLVPLLHGVLDNVCRKRESEGATTHDAVLTERERQIAAWVARGKTNLEIAHMYELSENTIKHHLTRIFDKYEVKTRTQLAQRMRASVANPKWLPVD